MLSPHAQAEERSYGDEIPVKLTNWTDVLSIPRFDPSQGILTKIDFVLTGKVNGRASLENLDAEAAIVSAESVADIRLDRPDGTHVTTASPRAAKTSSLSVFDGTIDFSGTSGTTISDIVGIDISEHVSYTDPASLAFFTGSGTIDMNVQTTSRSRATGAGNLALSFNTSAGAAITVTYFIAQPAIDLEKWTNDEDADHLPGPLLHEGDVVTWTYIVTNIGEVPLIDLTLVDDQEGDIIADCPQTVLAIAESMRCTHRGIVQRGQYTNTASVTGDVPAIYPGEPRQVQDSDPSHYTGIGDPAIDLEKLTNGDDADTLPGPTLVAGTVVTWSYIVHNVGGIALEAISLVDDREGAITAHCPQQRLAVGERMVCEVQGIAQLGQYTNTATVTGTTPSDSVLPHVTVTDEDPSHYFGVEIPLCPVDDNGAVLLPKVRFLGEGVGEYTVDNAEEVLVVKKLAPFRFILQRVSPYVSTRHTGAPERVWACQGDCIFQRGLGEVIPLGPLPQNSLLHFVFLDDDEDERINTIFADGAREQPLLRIQKQGLTTSLQVTISESNTWYVDAVDSIGLYYCLESR
ncbi:MAG: choice-of-anchor E domain-containing protein [Caldilineaceae bacterium]|nr:choice-of-anchor E domain-containing protein [Caldilineaceae bacterium]